MTDVRPSASTNTYVNFGFTAIPWFAGNVHGVVVQMTKAVSSSRISLPSLTLKATKIDGDFTSLYSISASAKEDSLDGDQ